MGYDVNALERDYESMFAYIRSHFAIDDRVGEGKWVDLNIEDVFSSIELHREFVSPESDTHARLTLARNLLTRYIQRVIAFSTQYKWGKHYREIKQFVDKGKDASLINFNWDLLLDQEFVTPGKNFEGPLASFEDLLAPRTFLTGKGGYGAPLYLKLHGSLNWFQCSNPGCSQNSQILVSHHIDDCLYRVEGLELGGELRCLSCASEMIPFIVPPILKKPVTGNQVLRAVWGHAMQKLKEATTVVVVGFSAAPSDFYARWLLRSTVGTRKQEEVEVYVVNPANDPDCGTHQDFAQRMATVFPRGYNSKHRAFSEIISIISTISG
jgi:NAD-dependent SIR2 family protein deacetylase